MQGVVTVGLETTTLGGGDENLTQIGTILENTVFTYELNYSNDELPVPLNLRNCQPFLRYAVG